MEKNELRPSQGQQKVTAYELPRPGVVPLFPGGRINSDACFLQVTFYGQISKQFTKAANPITLTLEKE